MSPSSTLAFPPSNGYPDELCWPSVTLSARRMWTCSALRAPSLLSLVIRIHARFLCSAVASAISSSRFEFCSKSLLHPQRTFEESGDSLPKEWEAISIWGIPDCSHVHFRTLPGSLVKSGFRVDGEIRRLGLLIMHYVPAACLDLIVNRSLIQEIFSCGGFATNLTSVRNADHRLPVQSEDSEFRESQGSRTA